MSDKKIDTARQQLIQVKQVPTPQKYQSLAQTLMAKLPPDFDSSPALPHFKHMEELTTDECEEAILAQVSPETWSSTSPSACAALKSLVEEAAGADDPEALLDSHEFAVKVASVIVIDDVPHELAIVEVAKAATRPGLRLADAHEAICCELRMLEVREHFPPSFEHDQYGDMADYIHSLLPVTARGPREFYLADERLQDHLVDAFINLRLEKAEIWDIRRDRPATIDCRLVAEVKAALARKYPRLPTWDADAGYQDVTMLESHPQKSNSVAEFAAAALELVPSAWTSSDDLWESYQQRCHHREVTPLARTQFFRDLKSWGSGRVTRTKPRDQDRTPGYMGVAISQHGPGGPGEN
jgi:hypothetical protein